jgi:3D (Asp-Asp-Asp) domain-containing protein
MESTPISQMKGERKLMMKSSFKYFFLITLLFVLINVFYIKPDTKALPHIQNEVLVTQALSLPGHVSADADAVAAVEAVEAVETEFIDATEVGPEAAPTPVKVGPEAVIPALVEKTSSSKPVNTSSESNTPGTAAAPLGASMGAFRATAYCLKGRTATGGGVRRGVVAADPRVLPLGSKIHVNAGAYSGVYTVSDTGGAIKGKILDVWVPNCGEANRFGRRTVQVTVHSRPAPKARAAKKAKK